LREAELLNNDARLAGIGARIIGEVFLGLLKRDRNSTPRPATGEAGSKRCQAGCASSSAWSIC
jgi:hypothetical protein